MSSLRPRSTRAALVATVGVATMLTAACGSGSSGGAAASPAAGSSAASVATSEAAPASSAAAPATSAAASTLPKTIVFSPLSLAPPALKGLSEGLKGYATSKGWEVVVQDPNFDATKQSQQLNEVLSSGRAGAAWCSRTPRPRWAR